jgi:hypothetical protein
MHLGQLDPPGSVEEQREHLRPADHRRVAAGERQGIVHRMRHLRALCAPGRIAGQHDVAAARQQAGQTLERPPAHDHRAAHGLRLEALEVRRQVPGQRAVPPDHAIVGARQVDRDHTATAALMCGCAA